MAALAPVPATVKVGGKEYYSLTTVVSEYSAIPDRDSKWEVILRLGAPQGGQSFTYNGLLSDVQKCDLERALGGIGRHDPPEVVSLYSTSGLNSECVGVGCIPERQGFIFPVGSS